MSTIYAGKAPIRRLGPHQFRVLEFALKYPGWHTVGHDRAARRDDMPSDDCGYIQEYLRG